MQYQPDHGNPPVQQGQPYQNHYQQPTYLNQDIPQGLPISQNYGGYPPQQGGYGQPGYSQPVYGNPYDGGQYPQGGLMAPQGQYQPVQSQGFQQPNVYTQAPGAMRPQIYVQTSAENCPFPVDIKCQYCNKTGRTRIDHAVGDHTMLAGCLICICCWPLFWIPCVMDDCKDRVHHCAHCDHVVGKRAYEMC